MLLSLFITTITTALALVTLPSLLMFWCFVADIPSAVIPYFDSLTDRCVVVIETGVQNTALATAIVNLTFVSSSSVEFLSVALCPAMYTIFSNTQMLILAGAVRHHLAQQKQREKGKQVVAADTLTD